MPWRIAHSKKQQSTLVDSTGLSHDLNFLRQLDSLPAQCLCGKIQFEALGVEGDRAQVAVHSIEVGLARSFDQKNRTNPL
jgi:hypothetical protein